MVNRSFPAIIILLLKKTKHANKTLFFVFPSLSLQKKGQQKSPQIFFFQPPAFSLQPNPNQTRCLSRPGVFWVTASGKDTLSLPASTKALWDCRRLVDAVEVLIAQKPRTYEGRWRVGSGVGGGEWSGITFFFIFNRGSFYCWKD